VLKISKNFAFTSYRHTKWWVCVVPMLFLHLKGWGQVFSDFILAAGASENTSGTSQQNIGTPPYWEFSRA
jgi:hypothetical protein